MDILEDCVRYTVTHSTRGIRELLSENLTLLPLLNHANVAV